MIKHYNLDFQGSVIAVFKFDVHESYNEYDWDNPFHTDINKYIYEKDGYLYIKGCKITNNPKGIEVIWNNLGDGNIGLNTGESYIDCVFIVDDSGYIICKSHKHSSNRLDRFLTKLLG